MAIRKKINEFSGNKGKPRPKWYERTEPNDIRYRGPLNYMHFQILGWLCIVASQASLIISIGSRLTEIPEMYANMQTPLEIVGLFSLPFLLIANFAQIMNGKKSYKSLLLKNFGAATGIWAVYAAFLHRYVIGTLDVLNDGTVSSMAVLEKFMEKIAPTGILCFNIFIDLFLCTLVMFFLNYRPKRIFTGKSIIVFRLFTLLPVAYEAGCMVLKMMAYKKEISISPYLYPALTVKPTMTFVLFIALAAYIKIRELRYIRLGKSHEEYQSFLHTRKNSWDFALFLAIAIALVSQADYLITREFAMYQLRLEEATGIWYSYDKVLGFGDTINLVFIAPLVLLFSYTRDPKLKNAGILIPVGAIALTVVLYLEAGRQAVPMLDPPKFNFEILVNPTLREELQEMDALPEPEITDNPPAVETESPQP